ncbi:MAG: hypothetical protein Q9200_003388 [Gallowayella weberi]
MPNTCNTAAVRVLRLLSKPAINLWLSGAVLLYFFNFRFEFPLWGMAEFEFPMHLGPDDTWVGLPEYSYPLDGPVISDYITWSCMFGIPIALLAMTFAVKRDVEWFWACWNAMLMSADFGAFMALPLKCFHKSLHPRFLSTCRPLQERMTEIWAGGTSSMMPVFFDLTICEDVLLPLYVDRVRYRELRSAITTLPSLTITTAFAIATFICLMMNAVVKPYAPRNQTTAFWNLVPLLIAPTCAVLFAMILVDQHTHTMTVAVSSAMLGIVSATMSYGCWFCSLFDYRDNDRPRSQRKEKNEYLPTVATRGGFPFN